MVGTLFAWCCTIITNHNQGVYRENNQENFKHGQHTVISSTF